MSTVTAASQREEPAALRVGAGLMTLGAVAFIGYGVIFIVRNFTDSFLELGIGPDQVDKDKDAIQSFSPELYHYISHLHLAIAGLLAGMGLAVAALSWIGVRRGLMWAWVSAVAAPVLALVVALPAHYPWGSRRSDTSVSSTSQLRPSSSARCCRERRCWTSTTDEHSGTPLHLRDAGMSHRGLRKSRRSNAGRPVDPSCRLTRAG